MFGRATYLIFELGWAVPVLVVQWAVGWRTLVAQRTILVKALVLSTAYLCLVDGIAIAAGIWTIHADRILGITLLSLPLEEALFFALTNAMVVQSVLLVLARKRTPR